MVAWVLGAVNESLEVVLGGAVTTNELQCVAHYADETGTAFTEDSNQVNTSGTTPVTLVAAPAANTRRLISDFSIHNRDTSDQTITVQLNIGGTTYIIYKSDLVVDSTLRLDGSTIGGQAFSSKYPPSATDPATPPPVEGDIYYNTVLDMIMMWDGTRSKWLSIESSVIQFGGAGITATGSYYSGTDGLVLSATNGYTAHFNGTIVSFGYTRDDTDAMTFDIVESGTSRATVASAAVAGQATNLDGNFTQGGVLAVTNQAGGNATTNATGWVRVKWRI